MCTFNLSPSSSLPWKVSPIVRSYSSLACVTQYKIYLQKATGRGWPANTHNDPHKNLTDQPPSPLAKSPLPLDLLIVCTWQALKTVEKQATQSKCQISVQVRSEPATFSSDLDVMAKIGRHTSARAHRCNHNSILPHARMYCLCINLPSAAEEFSFLLTPSTAAYLGVKNLFERHRQIFDWKPGPQLFVEWLRFQPRCDWSRSILSSIKFVLILWLIYIVMLQK